MRLLLDTRALLWWLDDDKTLGQRARDLIADPDNTVLVSIASLWEIVVKVGVGKLRADIGAVAGAIERSGFTPLDIRTAHLAALGRLPMHPDHRDPFDHLLVAQAIAEGATLVSEDGRMPRYPVAVVACSDPPGPSAP